MGKTLYSMSALAKILGEPVQNLQKWQGRGKTGIEKTEPKLSAQNVLGLIIYAKTREPEPAKIAKAVKEIMKAKRGEGKHELPCFGEYNVQIMLVAIIEDCIKHHLRRTLITSPLYLNILMIVKLLDSVVSGEDVVRYVLKAVSNNFTLTPYKDTHHVNERPVSNTSKEHRSTKSDCREPRK